MPHCRRTAAERSAFHDGLGRDHEAGAEKKGKDAPKGKDAKEAKKNAASDGVADATEKLTKRLERTDKYEIAAGAMSRRSCRASTNCIRRSRSR